MNRIVLKYESSGSRSNEWNIGLRRFVAWHIVGALVGKDAAIFLIKSVIKALKPGSNRSKSCLQSKERNGTVLN